MWGITGDGQEGMLDDLCGAEGCGTGLPRGFPEAGHTPSCRHLGRAVEGSLLGRSLAA